VDLRGANLTECDADSADFWNAKLFNTKLWHANFKTAKSISRMSFSEGLTFFDRARIDESGLLSAEESYRSLKTYFLASGMYNDASWASFNEKTMERIVMKRRRDLNYLPSLLMNILCGYGEKPYRIVLISLFTIILFAALFFSFGAIELSAAQSGPLKWSDYIYYSTITFTTVGYGDIIPKAQGLSRLMAAMEAFIGVFFTGLFIFTLARKYSAR
jgi:voltage-gated potassium channel Kch